MKKVGRDRGSHIQPHVKVKQYSCPYCGNNLAIIDVIEGQLPSGVVYGHSFVKCKSGCSKNKILMSAGVYKRKVRLRNNFFLEVIDYARSIGKRISSDDKQREVYLRMGTNRSCR